MIKVLVFDFSGVLYGSRFEMLTKSLIDIVPGLESDKIIETFYNKYNEYKLGKLTEPTFWSEVFSILEVPRDKVSKITKIVFDKGIFTENKYLLSQIEKLSKNYKIAVLSNSSREMEWIFDESNYYGFFDEFFWSHNFGSRKPAEKFYNAVLEKYKVKPSEILFFDDKVRNTLAADELGWNTVIFTPEIYKSEELFLKELEKFGVTF
ncbi:HAD-IA family hydrolase [Candidatus Woesearchaeota archaeon]|jgi:FMN phosphatase YigB (HAD superfamily)|nr:HAD-IA family hydrolase [Candidatus Woesearchaeota archaeon]